MHYSDRAKTIDQTVVVGLKIPMGSKGTVGGAGLIAYSSYVVVEVRAMMVS